MTALLLLLGAFGLLNASRGPAAPLAVAAALALALLAGFTLPDLDQWLPLDHRSALTHSALVPALALLDRKLLPLAAGLAIGIGFHLAADAFPNSMTGYATVKLPFHGSIGVAGSYWWLAVNAVAALGGGVWFASRAVTQPLWRGVLLALTVVVGGLYLLRTDGGWWVFALVLATGTGALALRRLLARTRSFSFR